jgi:hypothetical protein
MTDGSLAARLHGFDDLLGFLPGLSDGDVDVPCSPW